MTIINGIKIQQSVLHDGTIKTERIKRISFLFLLAIIFSIVFSQDIIGNQSIPNAFKKVIIMQPTGNIVHDLPEMEVIPDTANLYKTVMGNINDSFIVEFLDLFFIAQVYLKNNDGIDTIEPAYLALTGEQGGFVRFGFVIKESTGHIVKENTPYVDIMTGIATTEPDRLMSFTQLYPHELGHVIFNLLSPKDTVDTNVHSVDVHYFPIITDYATAFNEGFAIHCENVSRIFEKNETIKSGIFSDIDRVAETSKKYINGFERDFIYPFRLGYYKATMLIWYSQYENYRRYEQSVNGVIRYKNATLQLSCVKDKLSYRNSGVRLNSNEMRNIVQMHATEGAVSSFFTHLSTSGLSGNYLDNSFYKDFIDGTNKAGKSPQEVFSPLQNQFIKYFYVLHNYVVFNNSSKSQLIDFIDGYKVSFPDEANTVNNIYRDALGMEYSNKLPPPLWLLVKDYSHRMLLFDLFDVMTVPVYTFDLNAAEIEDLQTIDGITRNEAETIINYRNEIGYFTDLNQLKNISGLTPEVSDKIIAAEFDKEYYEELSQALALDNLNVGKLLLKPLQYLLSRASIYYLFIFGIVYVSIMKREKTTIKAMVFLFVKYFLLCMLFILVGLVTVLLFNQPYLYIIFFSILLALLTLIIYRKNKESRLRHLVIIGVMSLAVIGSVI